MASPPSPAASAYLAMFADNLARFMATANVETADLARALGTTTSKVGNWLAGRNFPQMPVAIQLCDRYGLTLDYLFRGSLYGLPAELADSLASGKAGNAAAPKAPVRRGAETARRG